MASRSVLLTSIYTYVSNISGLPTILYPNRKYPNDKMSVLPDEYIRTFVMPAKPFDIGLTQVKVDSGLIQFTITIKDDIGEIRAAEIADLLISAFPRGTIIPTSLVRIDKTPYASAGFTDGSSYYIMPVTVEYNDVTA